MTVPLIILAVLSLSAAWGWPLHDPERSWLTGRLEQDNHAAVGLMALFAAALGAAFAAVVYFFRVLDPAEAREQFPGLHRFLWNKWYFDDLYSALLVRPALVVGGWCRSFDLRGIDGLLHGTARGTVQVS